MWNHRASKCNQSLVYASNRTGLQSLVVHYTNSLKGKITRAMMSACFTTNLPNAPIALQSRRVLTPSGCPQAWFSLRTAALSVTDCVPEGCASEDLGDSSSWQELLIPMST